MQRYSRNNFRGGRYGRYGGRYNKNRRFARKSQSLNPMVFVKKAVDNTQDKYIPENKFTDFSFSDTLIQSVNYRGYKNPTPIQDKAIPALLKGQDVIGIASTGTGKTVAFLLPLIEKVYRNRSEKVLIIAPTRELAIQIDDEFRIFASRLKICSTICIGGTPMYRQISGLRRRPNFVIGTPGRLKDLDQQRVIRFGDYKSIVLDEVDRMLDMGFIPDIKYIISKLPHERQSLFFSATLPDKMKGLANSFLTNPITIAVKANNASDNVDQDIVRIGDRNKIEVLNNLLKQEDFRKVLVFGRTKWGIEKLNKNLTMRGFRVASIHGNKNQNQRQRALTSFRQDRIQVLLATDVASRGLDINDITHVINFDPPESYDDYIHRIGRTGRADKKGVALTFVK